MPEGVNAANGFGVQTGPTNVDPGIPAQTQQTQTQQVQVQQQQIPQQVNQGAPAQVQPNQQWQTGQYQQQVQAGQYQGQPTVDPRVAQAMELENAIRALGHDPANVIQQLRARQQELQVEAQRQAAQGMGVSPQLLQQMQEMGNQIQSVQRTIGEQRLREAETSLTTFAAQFGVDYNKPEVRMEIRQFALDNNVTLDTAFKSIYFDRIMTVNAQQATGQQLAALQGRAPQPVSTATPGSSNPSTVDYLNMSDKDFEAAAKQMRSQYYQR